MRGKDGRFYCKSCNQVFYLKWRNNGMWVRFQPSVCPMCGEPTGKPLMELKAWGDAK